jgi:hypothetical protein
MKGLTKGFAAVTRVSDNGAVMHDDKLAEELLTQLFAAAGPLEISVGLQPRACRLLRLFFLPGHEVNLREVVIAAVPALSLAVSALNDTASGILREDRP